MEQVMEKKTSKVPFYIIALVTLIACAGYFVGLGGYIALAAPMGITFSQFMNVWYASGGMIVACIVGALFVLFVLKNKREFWAKIFIWGILILSVLASAAFYANLAQMEAMDATQGFAFVSRYIPYVALSVASIAVIVQWDDNAHKAANMVSLVCMLVSAFMVIFQIKAIVGEIQGGLDATSTIDPVYLYQYMMLIFLAVSLVLITLLYFYVTLSRRKFDCVIIGMTDEEAEVVERIEARVDEIADEVEEIATQDAASIVTEEKAEAEIDEAAKEDTETVVIETETVIEEEIKEDK
ncbi:MAG: hypothetical protein RSB97_01050 [Christensenella sp.]